MAAAEPRQDSSQERAQRIRMLRGSIKLLLGIGFLFLLVPFFKSIPWPESEVPEGSVVITPADIRAGETILVDLKDGSAVFVTRSTSAQRELMSRIAASHLWSVSAPGIAEQEWWVVSAKSAQDEDVLLKPATQNSPAHLGTTHGLAWDLAGRALKAPAFAGISAQNSQNLLPMPFKRHDDGVLLMPLPPASAPVEIQE